MKRFCLSILASFFVLFFPTFAVAAAPDGAGPWADNVVSSSQGMRKNGTAVLPARSNPTAAVGVAENDTNDGSFFSLGFGGSITLGFDNGISGGTLVVEATNPGYPTEKAKVEVSPDGTTWTVAGNVEADGEVALPQSVTCAKFVRVTDTSNTADFSDDTADAYDVDGVKSTGETCTVPTPTPPCDQNDKDCCAGGDVKVSQKNKTVVTTVVSQVGNTGGNKIKDNTGGDNKIKTGNVKNKTSVQVQGGSNTAILDSSCCGGGSTNIIIKGNGKKSVNKVSVH